MARKSVISFEAEGLSRKHRRELRDTVRNLGQMIEEETVAAVADLGSVAINSGGGELFGPAYWNSGRIQQPEHQGTSFMLAAVYPFLAGPPVPVVGPVIALDIRSGAEFAFDPWQWYARGWISSLNVLVAGGYRQGKSFFGKMLITRSILFGNQGIATSDPKGEHARIARALPGGVVIRLGAAGTAARLNPLDRGPRRESQSDIEHEASIAARRASTLAAMVEMCLPRGSGLEPRQFTALAWGLKNEIRVTGDRPTIGGIYRRFESLTDTETGDGIYKQLYDDSRELRHALLRLVEGDLAGLFDGHSTVELDITSPYTVFDNSEMMQRGTLAMGLAQLVINSWVNSVIADKTSGRRFFIVAEEGWAEMSTPAALEALVMRQKLSGEYNICNMMFIHEGGDFKSVGVAGSVERVLAEKLVNGFANKITFRQEPGQLAATAPILGFTAEDVAEIGRLDVGQALFKVKDRSFLLSTMAVSSAWERNLFNTDGAATETPPAPLIAAAVGGGLPTEEPASEAVMPSSKRITFTCQTCQAERQRNTFCTMCGTAVAGQEEKE